MKIGVRKPCSLKLTSITIHHLNYIKNHGTENKTKQPEKKLMA